MTVNVGGVLFKYTRFTGLVKVTVTKITPTGNIRVSDGSLLKPNLSKKTSDPWDVTTYYAWSQELEDKYRLQNLQLQLNKKLKKLDAFELDEKTIETLLKALNDIGR